MNKILNLLLPILRLILNHEKLQKQSNNWNDSPIASKKTETLRSEIPIPETVEKPLFFHPVRIVSERVTSSYGYRTLNIDGKAVRQFHIGTDFGGSGPVYAVEDSIVVKSLAADKKYPVRFAKRDGSWVDLIKAKEIPSDRAWTPYVILKGIHTGNEYKYKHVDPSVEVGAEITAGTEVGRSGDFGYSMGAHLHFEVWKNSKTVDPVNFLKSLELVK